MSALALYESRYGMVVDIQARASFLGKANAQIQLAKSSLEEKWIR